MWPSTARRVVAVLALVVAGLAVLLGLLILLFAYVFSGGNEQLPEGFSQQLAWFSVPIAGIAGAGYATLCAGRLIEGSQDWTGFAAGLVVALGAYGLWWGLVEAFRG